MGAAGTGGVVDGDGRVHGVGGLVVADASVFPEVPRGTLTVPKSSVTVTGVALTTKSLVLTTPAARIRLEEDDCIGPSLCASVGHVKPT